MADRPRRTGATRPRRSTGGRAASPLPGGGGHAHGGAVAGREEDRKTMAGNTEPLSPRAKLAVTAGKAAAAVSRAAGKGSGSVIGGRVALKLDPDLLARLAGTPRRRPGLGDQRQDHHDPADRRGAAGQWPGGLQRAGRQHAGRHHLRAGRRFRRPLRRDRGGREVSGRGRPRRHAEGHRPAEPVQGPVGPGRRDPDARREVARGPVGHRGRGDRQRRRPAGGLGGLLLPDGGVGGRGSGVEGRRLVLPVLRRRAATPG